MKQSDVDHQYRDLLDNAMYNPLRKVFLIEYYFEKKRKFVIYF